jgi:hypothetical protein
MNLENQKLMGRFIYLAIAFFLVFRCTKAADEKVQSGCRGRPNVLFPSVDDLNDWMEPLGGHPQARTPKLNELAEQGVLFIHNYCASPVCNPSRTALLTGVHLYNSGMYSNYQYWGEVLPSVQTLPQYFMANGYGVGERARDIAHRGGTYHKHATLSSSIEKPRGLLHEEKIERKKREKINKKIKIRHA